MLGKCNNLRKEVDLLKEYEIGGYFNYALTNKESLICWDGDNNTPLLHQNGAYNDTTGGGLIAEFNLNADRE